MARRGPDSRCHDLQYQALPWVVDRWSPGRWVTLLPAGALIIGWALIASPKASAGDLVGSGEPLNVVFITLDTTRADALGTYGEKLPSSPNLDRLAAEGTRFEFCQSAVPSTLPSHSTLLTGQYPFVHGSRSNRSKLPTRAETLAEVLREHGYRTAAHVSAPVLDAVSGLDQGFEVYIDGRNCSTFGEIEMSEKIEPRNIPILSSACSLDCANSSPAHPIRRIPRSRSTRNAPLSSKRSAMSVLRHRPQPRREPKPNRSSWRVTIHRPRSRMWTFSAKDSA